MGGYIDFNTQNHGTLSHWKPPYHPPSHHYPPQGRCDTVMPHFTLLPPGGMTLWWQPHSKQYHFTGEFTQQSDQFLFTGSLQMPNFLHHNNHGLNQGNLVFFLIYKFKKKTNKNIIIYILKIFSCLVETLCQILVIFCVQDLKLN